MNGLNKIQQCISLCKSSIDFFCSGRSYSAPGRNGPSEFTVIGPLKDWTIVPDLHKIKASTLLINGQFDEAQDSVMVPFFKLIPTVKWVTFAESAHMPHVEETKRYLEVVGGFLTYE